MQKNQVIVAYGTKFINIWTAQIFVADKKMSVNRKI